MSFDELPQEIFCHMCNFIPINTIKNLQRVNKQLKFTFQDNLIWSNLITIYFGPIKNSDKGAVNFKSVFEREIKSMQDAGNKLLWAVKNQYHIMVLKIINKPNYRIPLKDNILAECVTHGNLTILQTLLKKKFPMRDNVL